MSVLIIFTCWLYLLIIYTCICKAPVLLKRICKPYVVQMCVLMIHWITFTCVLMLRMMSLISGKCLTFSMSWPFTHISESKGDVREIREETYKIDTTATLKLFLWSCLWKPYDTYHGITRLLYAYNEVLFKSCTKFGIRFVGHLVSEFPVQWWLS